MRKILSILMALVIVTLMFSTVSMGAGPMADDELSADGWKMSASSVNVNQETPEKAIDGSLSSYWHSLIEPKAPAPHYIQLEMREATAISGYRYYPRKQGGAGTCTNYEVLVSLDGESFELAARGTCSNDTSPKTINFGANIVCKYVRFIMINSTAGYGAAGEVRVLAPKDTLKTREVIPGMIIHKDEISIEGMEIEASGTYHEKGIIRNPLGNLLDSNRDTFWKSSDINEEQTPHFLTIVLPKSTKVFGYRYNPRTNGEGACSAYEIWVSADGKNFNKIKEGVFGDDVNEKEIWFDAPVIAKKVKFVMKEVKGSFAMASEIRLIGEEKKADNKDAGNVEAATGELSTSGWTFITSSTNSNNGVPQEKAENVIDGSAESHWHTTISPKAEGPHFITVVLPSVQKVGGYIYTPRSNMGAGTVTKYEISVSLDNVNYTKVAEGDWRHDAEVKTVEFEKSYDAKYVKLTILEGVGGFGSAAEIRLIGSKVTASSEAVQETTGEAATGELSTSGWTFITSSTNSSNGVPREKPENVIDGSAESHWHTTISPKAEGPHFITVVLPSVQKVGGYIYTPRSNMGAGTVTKYEISVSLDNVNYTKVAEGDWRHDAEVKTVEFEKSYDAKYVKLTILEGVGGFGSAAEIRLIGSKVTASSEAVQETTGEAATGVLSTSGWTFITSSTNSDENGVPREKPENVIDGSAESHWHTAISPKAEGPHFITVVLPNVQKVGGYVYTPRSNMGAGTVTKYEISVSLDNVNYTKVAEGNWRHDAAVKTVVFEKGYDAKYVKLTILEGVAGFGSAAEIRLLDDSVISSAETTAEEEGKYKTALFPGTTVKSSGKSQNMPQLMVDGDAGSYWHSEVKPENLPVNLDFEFFYPYTISGISYLPRQDGNFAGYFQEFYIYTSDDGENFNLVKKCSFAQINALEKRIYFDEPVKTKHLRIYLVAGNGGYGTCAELGFIQTKEDYERDYKLAEEIYKLQIDSKDIYVKKNGVEKTVKTDVAPYIYEGSTMIPLRGLLAEMGAEITWISDIQRIEVKTDKSFLEFRIEDDEAFMDSVRYSMPVAPQITEGRTFIPLRFVSENLGYYVYWNGETREITITNYEQ